MELSNIFALLNQGLNSRLYEFKLRSNLYFYSVPPIFRGTDTSQKSYCSTKRLALCSLRYWTDLPGIVILICVRFCECAACNDFSGKMLGEKVLAWIIFAFRGWSCILNVAPSGDRPHPISRHDTPTSHRHRNYTQPFAVDEKCFGTFNFGAKSRYT